VYADISLRLPSTSALWASDAFRAELSDWVTAAVGTPRSVEQVRRRPWSTVSRVEAEAGVFFAKQNTPLQAFEAGLVSLLTTLAPGQVVPVTAADPARDLLLTPDQGPTLGDVLEPRLDETGGEELVLATVSRVIRSAAELQRELVPHHEELTRAGLTRLSPADALPYVQQRLDELSGLPDGDPRAFEPGAAAKLEAFLPAVAAAVDEVGSLGLPVTLDHNDLHTYNVFDHDGHMRFFDFGDAVLAEPLGALRGPLSGLAHHFECPMDDPRLLDALEPALEVWSDLVPLPQLRAALPSAFRLSRLTRCESWLRCYPSMTDAELGEFGDGAAYWLASVADD
jgi:hypothetical protein